MPTTPRIWGPGKPLTPEQYEIQLRERFWAKVNKSSGQGPSGECWEWQGSTSNGYGQISVMIGGKSKPVKTHSLAFTRIYRHILKADHVVCHDCNNKKCVRDSHLISGTTLFNVRHAQRTGLISSKLSAADINTIRRMIDAHTPYLIIAEQFKISISYISKINHKVRLAHY